MHMKKIFIILFVLVLVGLGLFLFLFRGNETVSNFFNENTDFGSFFDIEPQSQNDFISTDPTTDPVTETPVGTKYTAPTLRQISLEPISGFTYYSTTSTSTRIRTDSELGEFTEEYQATSTAIRFQERATGHLYDVFEFSPNPQKVSNITIQKIYNTIFTNNRNEFLTQTLSFNNEQIKTTFTKNIPATISTSTNEIIEEQKLEQSDISTVVSDFLYIPNLDKIVYSIKRTDGSDIYISDTQRTSETGLTNTPLKEFTLEYINDTHALLQTSASANSVGYAYTLNLTSGALTKIIGNIPGLLVKISPNLEYFLYSQSDASRPVLRALNINDGTVRRINLDTIPEKCVFSKVSDEELYCFGSLRYKSAAYPDDWYKGKVFNNENLYKINLANGLTEVVYVFSEDEVVTNFDVLKPQITNEDSMIIFQNKVDLTLWSLNLKNLDNQF